MKSVILPPPEKVIELALYPWYWGTIALHKVVVAGLLAAERVRTR